MSKDHNTMNRRAEAKAIIELVITAEVARGNFLDCGWKPQEDRSTQAAVIAARKKLDAFLDKAFGP
jgi:hypothetical protein